MWMRCIVNPRTTSAKEMMNEKRDKSDETKSGVYSGGDLRRSSCARLKGGGARKWNVDIERGNQGGGSRVGDKQAV